MTSTSDGDDLAAAPSVVDPAPRVEPPSPPVASTISAASPTTPPVHRVRDLDRRGRWVAAGIALLLVLVPMVAAAVNHGRWEPQGDDALIELRARDVGTARNPLVGQPSTSGSYGERAENVAHPGPLGFVVLAPTTRLLGPVTGTLLATALVSAASMVAVAWLLFRQLGPRGGAAGAILVALAAFSAGAGGLVEPISSNFGRMPLLAAAVAVWALFCGDLRIAPLAVFFWSFAAQQHLSVLPAAAVLGGAGAVAAVWWIWRTPAGERLRSSAWVGGGVALGVVMWGPVWWQQLTGDPGNLSALAHYSGDSQRQDLGLRSAVTQVANVLGPRPFLGRSSPRGWDLIAHRSTLGVLLTFLVVGAILAAGSWWLRREPKFLAVVVMIGVLSVAAVLTGMNIPDSPEKGRLNFFHWAFALSFFVLLAFGWLLARLAPVVTPKLTHGRAVTAVAVAAIVVLAVAVTPLVTDRASDRLTQPLAASTVADVIHQLQERPMLGGRATRGSGPGGTVGPVAGPILVLVNGDDRYIQVGDTIGSRLATDGVAIVFPPSSAGYVHPDRIADVCTVPNALVVTLGRNGVATPPGTELAQADGAPGLDRKALRRLEAQAKDQPVDLGADLEGALDSLPGGQGDLVGATIALRLADRAEEVLLVRSNLDLLIDHPIASPALDRDDLVALRDSLPEGAATVAATEVTAHLLDRQQLEAFRPDLFARC